MEPADLSMPEQLRGPDGHVLGSVEPDPAGSTDAAMVRSGLVRSLADADPTDIAHAIVASFADWQITVDDQRVADALAGLGEVLVRHAHLMCVSVADGAARRGDRIAGAASGGSYRIGPLHNEPDRYAHLMLSAYPVGHVDHDPDELLPGGARHSVGSYFSGAVIGPVRWDASCEATFGDEAIGFVVVSTSAPGRVFPGGPWVTDIAVDPRFHGHGIGRALLTHAIHELADAGDERLGLAVSHGNRARDLYARLGFIEIFESWRFMIGA